MRYSRRKNFKYSIPGEVSAPGGDVIKVRSQFECHLLHDLNKRQVGWEYETVKLAYTITHTYTPDIVLRGPNKTILVEAKGRFMPGDRSKLIAVKEQCDVDLRLVFSKGEAKLSKRSKTTYFAWGKRNGFEVAEGRIPESWVNELRRT